MTSFRLHPRLEADTEFVADFALSRVLAMNDARYPWLILVPRRDHLTEIHDLSHEDRTTVIDEIARASTALKSLPGISKINVGALGNLVPQLHIHVIGRHPGDAAWPGPVWGNGHAVAYTHDALKDFVKGIGTAIAP